MTSPVPVNPVGRITSTTARYLGSLDAQASQAMLSMSGVYSTVIHDLGSELTKLEEDIERRLAETGKVPVSWLHRQQRYQTLIVQSEKRFEQYGAQLGQYLGVSQRRAIDLARQNAEALLESALPGFREIVGTFHSMPDNVLRQIQGSLSAGSPLTELLDGFGSWGRAVIEENLTTGLVKGLPPKEITKRILKDYQDQTPYRTNLIVKTEMMRAFREANRATYAANKNLVKRWVWFAHLGRGTCSACLAMHGTKHPLDEPMGSHPACTCTMLPETKTWAELGYPDVPEVNFLDEIGDGEDFLRNADEKTQRLAFGNNGVHAEWKAGNVKLADTVRTTHTPKWGTNRTIAGRQAALDNAAARRAREIAEEQEKARLAASTTRKPRKTAQKTVQRAWDEDVRASLAGGIRDEAHAREIGAAINAEVEQKIAAKVAKLEAERLAKQSRYDEISEIFKEDDRRRRELGERGMGFADRIALRDERRLLDTELRKTREKIAATYRNEVRKALAKVRPGFGEGLDELSFLASDKPLIKTINAQKKNFPAEWWDDFKLRRILSKKVDRGYFREDDSIVRVMISGNSSSTATHELTHFAEYMRPRIRQIEHEFYTRRTLNEPVTPMSWSKDGSEVTRLDKFVQEYIGKSYGAQSDSYYEVATMGVEGLWHDTSWDIRKDEEYVNLILGILAGL